MSKNADLSQQITDIAPLVSTNLLSEVENAGPCSLTQENIEEYTNALANVTKQIAILRKYHIDLANAISAMVSIVCIPEPDGNTSFMVKQAPQRTEQSCNCGTGDSDPDAPFKRVPDLFASDVTDTVSRIKDRLEKTKKSTSKTSKKK